MTFKFPVSLVFNPAGFTIIITKLGYCQIHIPVVVEVTGTDIGNAGYFFGW